MDEQLELEARIQQEMAGSEDFLEGAHGVRREASRALLRAGSPHSWQKSSSASRPGLNRIPAALGHLVSSTLAFFTPQSGGSPNANQIDSLYKITLYIALVIFVLVEGGLAYALVKFRARKGAVAAQIRGNTRLEVGWTVAAAVILLGLAVVTFAKLSSIQNPAELEPERRQAGRRERPAVRERRAQAAPQRQIAEHHGHRAPVHLAVHLPGRERTRRPGRPVLLRGNGRPHQHDGHPRHRLRGRRALVVDPRTRRQVPGRARIPQLHLVQGRQARGLPRAVRPAVRARARAHDRHA